MLTVRPLRQEEVSAYDALSSICFTYPLTPEEAPLPPEKLAEYHGAFDADGRLVAGMIQLGMDARFEGRTCRLLGVGGVVTDPARRGEGAIRTLFEEALPRQYAEGYTFSALYPFSHIFYRKFGFEWALLRRRAQFSPASLRADLPRAASVVRVLPGEDDRGMRQVYETYAQRRNFAILRDDDRWQRLRKGTPWEQMKYAYVLRDEQNAPIAYWIGQTVKEKQICLEVKDMAYVSPRGLAAILAMWRTMNEFELVRLNVPADVELRYYMRDPYDLPRDHGEQTCCGGMVRVVNAMRALSMLPAPHCPGQFTVAVTDEQISENNGQFTVSGDGHRLTVTRNDASPADLRCGIGGLSVLVAGTVDYQTAVAAGLAEQSSGADERFLAETFRKRQSFLHDNF